MHDTKFTDFPRQHKLPYSIACQDHISYSAKSQAQQKASATQPSSRNNYWAQNTLSIKSAALSSTSKYARKPICLSSFLLSIFLPFSPALILSLLPIHQPSIPLVLLLRPLLQFQTDSTHKGNSIAHNSAPPIGLHAHLVATAIWVSPCSIPHTANQASHALPCSTNGKAAATKANGSRKQKLNFQGQGMFIGYGDLISRYICNPSVFKQLGPSTSLNMVECGRFADLDEISPTYVHQHLGQCIVNSLLQSQNFPFHQHAQQTNKGLPSS